MKQLTEYRRVSAYLDKIFNKLNTAYFENSLSKPIITIQSTPAPTVMYLSQKSGRAAKPTTAMSLTSAQERSTAR